MKRPPKPKILYCVNHDDAMFLGEQYKGEENNVPLAVYMDVCREAARLWQLFGARARKRIVNRKLSNEDWLKFEESGGLVRVTFFYDPKEVIDDHGFKKDEVLEALRILSGNGIVWVGKEFRGTYRVVLPEIKLGALPQSRGETI